jgi:hypothetical protein
MMFFPVVVGCCSKNKPTLCVMAWEGVMYNVAFSVFRFVGVRCVVLCVALESSFFW